MKKEAFTTNIVLLKHLPRKTDNLCPVAIRVTINRKPYIYRLGHYLSEADYYNVIPESCKKKPEKLKAASKSKLTNNEAKDIRKAIQSEENRAIEILKTMIVPSFEKFKRLYTQKGSGGNVVLYFNNHITELKKEQKYSTAETYNAAMLSFINIKGFKNANFKDITPNWLSKYFKHMREQKKKLNTISIYLRCLRYLFNKAISDSIVPASCYPFSKNIHEKDKFRLPTPVNNKRPLEPEEMFALAKYKGNLLYEKHRDFFFLSYLLSGLNFADLLTIKWNDISDNTLTITRQKTQHNENDMIFELELSLSAWTIINKHGNNRKGVFLFDIISERDSKEVVRKKIRNFTRSCNQALKQLAKILGINPNISTIYARHSSASHAAADGANIGAISQALGHSNTKTTQNYLSTLKRDRTALSASLEKVISKSIELN